MNECPIGREKRLETRALPIERVTVRLLAGLKSCHDAADELVAIAADGKVSTDEYERLKDIVDTLDDLTKSASALKIIQEREAAKYE